MNNDNTPRYKASMPIQPAFLTNADKCGDHIFTQIKRTGNVAVYRRNEVDTNKLIGFEVFVIKTVKAGTVFAKGGTPTENDYESYPGSSSFGKSAWFCVTEDRAMERFDQLVEKNSEPKGPKIPSGNFTLMDFATSNNLGLTKETADVLTSLIRSRVCKFIGNVVMSGRPVQTFVGV